jgi:WD40 repeat protein
MCPVTGHAGCVYSVCFDHTGKKLASGASGDNSVRLWCTESGAPIGSLTGHRYR